MNVIPAPVAVWDFTNDSISRLQYGLRFCRELERGELSQPALNVLKKYSKPGPSEILYALGRGSGCTREPARNNRHAGLTRLLGELWESIDRQIWDKLSVNDCPDDWLKSFTAGELAAIAADFGPRLAAITPKELKDEAEAACLMLEGKEVGEQGVVQPVPEDDVPVFLGGGKYEFQGETTVVQGQAAAVLESLVELRAATMQQLIDRSKVPNPSAVLTALVKKHLVLAPFITLPGGKCSGGYSTRIRALKASEATDNQK